MNRYVFFVSRTKTIEYLNGIDCVYVWADDLSEAHAAVKSYLGEDAYVGLVKYEEYRFKHVTSSY